MKRRTVDSSIISEIGYDRKTRELQLVLASGKLYKYSDVTIRDYHRFILSSSLGRGFNDFIRNAYDGVEIPR